MEISTSPQVGSDAWAPGGRSTGGGAAGQDGEGDEQEGDGPAGHPVTVAAPPGRRRCRPDVRVHRWPRRASYGDGMDTTMVADLSEDELIASFVPLLPRGRHTLVPSGDDAAVVAAPDGRFCVSTDVLVEDLHFRLDWGDGADVGWRAAAQNLSDIAAMGAEPSSMVVSLVLPPTTSVAWVHDLSRGFAELCGPLGVGVDGGDLSAGTQLVVAVTVHGDLGGRRPVLRSGARPGDVVAHAGVLGHAAAGMALLASGRSGGADDGLIGAFLRPHRLHAPDPRER
ncbi:thiamine-phosphate kinase [Georgenia sp. SUBG003]|uniref:thiamine-phosphate kinase n=1 Tax=Georgenia sp. SUBG003 TaxID=1497974 RepID=UPI003AB783FD